MKSLPNITGNAERTWMHEKGYTMYIETPLYEVWSHENISFRLHRDGHVYLTAKAEIRFDRFFEVLTDIDKYFNHRYDFKLRKLV